MEPFALGRSCGYAELEFHATTTPSNVHATPLVRIAVACSSNCEFPVERFALGRFGVRWKAKRHTALASEAPGLRESADGVGRTPEHFVLLLQNLQLDEFCGVIGVVSVGDGFVAAGLATDINLILRVGGGCWAAQFGRIDQKIG
jgi:hypothetical protein